MIGQQYLLPISLIFEIGPILTPRGPSALNLNSVHTDKFTNFGETYI